MIHRHLARAVTGAVVAGLLASTVPAPVSARVVSTEEVLSRSTTPASDRATLDALLARDDVRAQLEALGVDPADARARVQALDDQDARELAARIDQLPAGSGVLGVLFAVFVILLVTDILGFTKIFSFTRSVR
jgi:hypothetical protein